MKTQGGYAQTSAASRCGPRCLAKLVSPSEYTPTDTSAVKSAAAWSALEATIAIYRQHWNTGSAYGDWNCGESRLRVAPRPLAHRCAMCCRGVPHSASHPFAHRCAMCCRGVPHSAARNVAERVGFVFFCYVFVLQTLFLVDLPSPPQTYPTSTGVSHKPVVRKRGLIPKCDQESWARRDR